MSGTAPTNDFELYQLLVKLIFDEGILGKLETTVKPPKSEGLDTDVVSTERPKVKLSYEKEKDGKDLFHTILINKHLGAACGNMFAIRITSNNSVHITPNDKVGASAKGIVADWVSNLSLNGSKAKLRVTWA